MQIAPPFSQSVQRQAAAGNAHQSKSSKSSSTSLASKVSPELLGREKAGTNMGRSISAGQPAQRQAAAVNAHQSKSSKSSSTSLDSKVPSGMLDREKEGTNMGRSNPAGQPAQRQAAAVNAHQSKSSKLSSTSLVSKVSPAMLDREETVAPDVNLGKVAAAKTHNSQHQAGARRAAPANGKSSISLSTTQPAAVGKSGAKKVIQSDLNKKPRSTPSKNTKSGSSGANGGSQPVNKGIQKGKG